MTGATDRCSPGLHGVVAADTATGAVHGDEGYFHYGARRHRVGPHPHLRRGAVAHPGRRLPSADELKQFGDRWQSSDGCRKAWKPLIEVVAAMDAPPLAKLAGRAIGEQPGAQPGTGDRFRR
nr:hypothetical protein [Candidatus Microthrix sp.]